MEESKSKGGSILSKTIRRILVFMCALFWTYVAIMEMNGYEIEISSTGGNRRIGLWEYPILVFGFFSFPMTMFYAVSYALKRGFEYLLLLIIIWPLLFVFAWQYENEC